MPPLRRFFSTGVPTRRRTRSPTSQSFSCAWTSGAKTRLLCHVSTLCRRADLSSWASEISCKVCCRSALYLHCRVRCTNQGNETMCLRTDATVRAARVDGGVSLQAREKTVSLLRKTGGRRNEQTDRPKARQQLCQGLPNPVQSSPNQRLLHAPSTKCRLI